MLVNLTKEQLEKILESLQKTQTRKSDEYLINYLKVMRSSCQRVTSEYIDDCPF